MQKSNECVCSIILLSFWSGLRTRSIFIWVQVWDQPNFNKTSSSSSFVFYFLQVQVRVEARQKYQVFRVQVEKNTKSTFRLNRSLFVSMLFSSLPRHEQVNDNLNLHGMISKNYFCPIIFSVYKFRFNNLELKQFLSSPSLSSRNLFFEFEFYNQIENWNNKTKKQKFVILSTAKTTSLSNAGHKKRNNWIINQPKCVWIDFQNSLKLCWVVESLQDERGPMFRHNLLYCFASTRYLSFGCF